MSGSLSQIFGADDPTSMRGQSAPSSDPSAPSGLDDATMLPKLTRNFEEWAWATREERERNNRDLDYYYGHQWTAEEIEELHRRGQPALVINYVIRKVEYQRGFELRLRSDPKAFPRNPSDEQSSDAATQALRYVCDDNAYDQIRSNVFTDMLVPGTGGCDVICEPGIGDDVDVRYHHIPWSRLWWDPHSAKPNFTDANYMGNFTWMDRDDAVDMWPGSESVLDNTLTLADDWGSLSDRPRSISWADTHRTRVMVAQGHWKKGDTWYTATFTKGGFLAPPVVSPYLDRRGKTCCPQRMRSLYVDRDNRRFGFVRQLISLQDEINKRRSKSLHLLSVRQVIADQGAVDDVDRARAELAKPDGFLVKNPNLQFEVLPTGDLTSGQIELLKHATEEMNATGPNAAMTGKDPREQSGRAIQAQQQGGAVENEPSIDALRQFDREIYEATWMRVRQFWTGEKWIRITDEDSNVQFVGLNHQVTLADTLAQMPDDQRAQAMQALQLQPGDPRLQHVVKVENDISSLDVDITVEDGPDISTLQAEQLDFLKTLIQVPPAMQILMVKYSNVARKNDMIKDLKAMQDAGAAAAAQQQQHALAMQQSEIALNNAKANASNASAAEKNAGAAERVHGIATDHAYLTAPDHAPPGHHMALANVAGASVPTAPPQPVPMSAMPPPQQAPVVPDASPMPAPDLSAIPDRPPLPA